MASSISTNRPGLARSATQAAVASLSSKLRERFVTHGAGGYVLTWLVLPIFQIAITGLIYRGTRPDLLGYIVVGIAMGTFIFNSQYYVGEILDEERIHGTLAGLFLAPCPRLAWLAGFSLGGLVDTILAAAAETVFGIISFGVRFDPNYPALILSFLLFFLSLWGLGFVFSAAGLVLKRSNDLSNLLSPFIFLLGGIYYPISLLPLWLTIPAHALPFGYGVQAMASAALHHEGIAQLGAQLLPLAGFAIGTPILGVLAFGWVEHKVRARGDLELY